MRIALLLLVAVLLVAILAVPGLLRRRTTDRRRKRRRLYHSRVSRDWWVMNWLFGRRTRRLEHHRDPPGDGA